MKKYTIGVTEEKGLEFDIGEVTIEEGLELTFMAMEMFVRVAHEQMVKAGGEDKDVRGKLYDLVILKMTDVINNFYPEHVELHAKTPEALIERMEELLNATNRQE